MKNIIFNKNTIIIVLLIIVVILAKCSSDNNSELKRQKIISENNMEVLNDSIKKIRTSTGHLISEKGVLISDIKNLNSLNEDLYNKYTEIKKEIDDAEPSFIVQYKNKIIHDTVYLHNELLFINDSTIQLVFRKDTIYSKNNSRHLEGIVYAKLKSDTSRYNKLLIDDVIISRDEMNIEASLILGMKDDKLKVWLESKYPGFNNNDINSVILDPNIHPELRTIQNNRLSFGIVLGVGVNTNLSIQPFIGVGYQYRLF